MRFPRIHREAARLLGAVLVLSASMAFGSTASVRSTFRPMKLDCDADWTPRRLFNAGLRAEESHAFSDAVGYYLSARRSLRESFVDELYAERSGWRLLQLLSMVDEEAAGVIALDLREDRGAPVGDEEARAINRLADRVSASSRMVFGTGNLRTIRALKKGDGPVRFILDTGRGRFFVESDSSIHPFSAGDNVDFVIRKTGAKHAQLLALKSSTATYEGWQILRARLSDENAALAGLAHILGSAAGQTELVGR